MVANDISVGMASSNQVFTIDFGTGGNSQDHTASGWSTPETTETWSVGTSSRLALPAMREQAAYVLMLHLRPYTVDGRLPRQRLRVLVGGTVIAEFNLERRTTRACVIPWHVMSRSLGLVIDFETPDAASASSFGNSTDRRQLGVAFRTITIYPDRFGPEDPDQFLARQDALPIDIQAVTAADHIQLHELMLHFESLGQNCEFGLVQRKCQAEPLGLLRFSSTPLPQLLRALEEGFEGMGDADNIVVNISPNGREYMVSDKSYGFLYHAWVATGEMALEEVHRREVRRVPFLVRKLLEDLEGGEKIFVFKGMGAMADEEAFPLAMALRRYGPAMLLFVTLADAEHRGGTVEMRAPGFLIGFVDRFAPGEDAYDFLLAQWVKICREAYRLRLATTRTVA
jgi:hypothetical protein